MKERGLKECILNVCNNLRNTWRRWVAVSAYFECFNEKKMLLVLITYNDEFSYPCFMDWNGEINLGCILLYLLSKETEPMFDNRKTLYRWCTERKSSQKETREICPCGDQGYRIRKMRWDHFYKVSIHNQIYTYAGKRNGDAI